MSTTSQPDFFISHTKADEDWAQWVAQTLEANGYSTLIMQWDFLPGHNFVVRMQEAAAAGVRVLAVISPSYMESLFGVPEWAAAFASDPRGEQRRLIPIIVEPTADTGLLNQLVPINLVGVSEERAVALLLAGVGSSERRKPDEAMAFPGGEMGAGTQPTERNMDEEWQPLAEKASYLPRAQQGNRSSWESNLTLEVYLLSVPPTRMQMAAFRDLPDEIAARGRGTGHFHGSQALTTEVRDVFALAETQPGRDTASRGLSVTREGQVCVWEGLAQDSMGAVIDVSHIQSRIAALLPLATSLNQNAERYAVSARLITNGTYIFGDASVVGNRSSASGLNLGNGEAFEAPPEDTVSSNFLQTSPGEISIEIAARLEAAWSKN